MVLLGALLVVFFYFWFVLPAAWYHKVRYDDRNSEPDPSDSSLTVLVPAYNEERCLGRCLDSLAEARSAAAPTTSMRSGGWLAGAGVPVVDSTALRRAPGVRLLVGERSPA